MYVSHANINLYAALPVIFIYSLFHSVKKAISIINELDGSKFGRIIGRVLQKLHMKVCLFVCACM